MTFPEPPEPAPSVPPVTPVEPVVETHRARRPRRPVFGIIAFVLLVVAVLVLAGATVWGYLQTRDAFVPGPPWFTVTATIAIVPVAALCVLGLLLGIVGLARREKPGWPAVLALILAFPGIGYVLVAGYVLLTVTLACAGPAGACR